MHSAHSLILWLDSCDGTAISHTSGSTTGRGHTQRPQKWCILTLNSLLCRRSLNIHRTNLWFHMLVTVTFIFKRIAQHFGKHTCSLFCRELHETLIPLLCLRDKYEALKKLTDKPAETPGCHWSQWWNSLTQNPLKKPTIYCLGSSVFARGNMLVRHLLWTSDRDVWSESD